MPEFIDRINNEGDKYLAEVYFSSLKNVRRDKAITTTPESRLRSLAERFPGNGFKLKRNREIALILVSRSYSKSKALNLALTKEVEGLSLGPLLESENSETRIMLLAAYLSTQIQLANLEPVQARWKQLNKIVETRYKDGLHWRARSSR